MCPNKKQAEEIKSGSKEWFIVSRATSRGGSHVQSECKTKNKEKALKVHAFHGWGKGHRWCIQPGVQQDIWKPHGTVHNDKSTIYYIGNEYVLWAWTEFHFEYFMTANAHNPDMLMCKAHMTCKTFATPCFDRTVCVCNWWPLMVHLHWFRLPRDYFPNPTYITLLTFRWHSVYGAVCSRHKNYGQVCMKPAYCDPGAAARRGTSECFHSICFELWGISHVT